MDTQLTAQDIEFLKAIAALIGGSVERMPLIKEDLNGIRLYGATLIEGELGAAHEALKMFIQDKVRGYGPR